MRRLKNRNETGRHDGACRISSAFQQHAAFHVMGIRELIEQRQTADPVGGLQRFKVGAQRFRVA